MSKRFPHCSLPIRIQVTRTDKLYKKYFFDASLFANYYNVSKKKTSELWLGRHVRKAPNLNNHDVMWELFDVKSCKHCRSLSSNRLVFPTLMPHCFKLMMNSSFTSMTWNGTAQKDIQIFSSENLQWRRIVKNTK